jgi:hypothetical protein
MRFTKLGQNGLLIKTKKEIKYFSCPKNRKIDVIFLVKLFIFEFSVVEAYVKPIIIEQLMGVH